MTPLQCKAFRRFTVLLFFLLRPSSGESLQIMANELSRELTRRGLRWKPDALKVMFTDVLPSHEQITAYDEAGEHDTQRHARYAQLLRVNWHQRGNNTHANLQCENHAKKCQENLFLITQTDRVPVSRP